MGATEQLARLAIETPGATLRSPEIVASAKLRFLDTIGIMIAGSRHPSALISLDLARHLGGRPAASVVGHADRTSSPLAGYLNGVSAHALEYDDYTKSATHVSVCMVPGTLALAEEANLSGRALVEGFVAGFEVEARICKGMRPYLLDHGWHPNGVMGAMGVAAAGARLLGLDLMRTRMALGVAASEGSGVRKNVGSMGKAFHVGHGVRCGIFAALLAQRGFKVDPDIIEGNDSTGLGHDRFGLADTFNGVGNHRLELMVEGLGSHWELAQNTTIVRMHPGSTAPQAAIDGMIELAGRHDLKPEQVERITLETTPQAMAIACYPEARDSHKARFSLPYSMAVALIDRRAGIAQYTDERVNRDDVQALMKRVTVVVPDDLKHHMGQWGEKGINWAESRLAVRLKDGRVLTEARSYAKGWSENPATWDDLAGKFCECADGILSPGQRDETMAMIRGLDRLDRVRDLMAALQVRA